MSDWFALAACRGKPSEFWFPPPDTPAMSQYYNIGRLFCDRCPVWDDCLDYGKDEPIGMWGGLIPKERAFLGEHQRFSPKEHGTVVRYRQGCKCRSCEDAAYTQLDPLPPSLIPNRSDTPVDIAEVKKAVQEFVSPDKRR